MAIDLTHDGEPGDLVAVAMVPGPPGGFAAALPLRDGAPVQRLHGLGPLIGTEWSGGRLRGWRTVLAAANPGPGPMDAEAVLRWESEDGTRELRRRIELPAGGTSEFEFVPPDNVHAARRARLEVVSAEPTEAVFAAFSVDDTGRSRLEIPLQPSPGIQSGSYPFTMEEGVPVSFHLHNAGPDPQVFRSVIEYEGGEYVFPAVRLDPGDSWQEDLDDLAAGAPDLLGRTLPSDFRAGRFLWINDDRRGALLGRLRVVRGDRAAYGLSCPNCPCWTDLWSDVWDGARLVGTTSGAITQPFRREVPETGTLSATTHRFNTCPGGGTINVAADVTEWSPQPPSGLLSLTNTVGTPVGVHFNLAGSGGILCRVNNEKYSVTQNECSHFTTAEVAASVAVESRPSVTGFSPGLLPLGKSTTVTIGGTGFNAGATISVAGNGVGATTQSATSTQITASFTVDRDADPGGHEVRVTVNSQTSDPADINVMQPHHLLVVDDLPATILGGCAPKLLPVARIFKFQVVDQSGAPVGVVDVEEVYISLGANTCGNGSPSPSACGPVDQNSQFPDGVTVGCNTTGGSCGYDIQWRWHWCGPGSATTALGTLNGVVHHDAITVNGYTMPPGTKGIPRNTAILP